jgi:hypothetical protein
MAELDPKLILKGIEIYLANNNKELLSSEDLKAALHSI